MIGFDERTDNKEKNNFIGDRWRSLWLRHKLATGRAARTNNHRRTSLEHKQNGWKGTGSEVCDASQARSGVGCRD